MPGYRELNMMILNHFRSFVSRSKSAVILGLVFWLFFLVLCPLGTFESWIPQGFHKGFYALIQIDPADDANWYGLARSQVFDQDLDLSNEEFYLKNPEGQVYRKGGFYYAKFLTRTGYNFVMPYGFGSAVLWTPFLLVGHQITRIMQAAGGVTSYGVETLTGYDFPDLVFVALGSMFFVFFGLLLCQRVFANYFSEKASWLATAAIFFCSELPYFTFIRNRLLHANEFFAMALAMTFWDRVYRQKNKNSTFDFLFMGLAFGFLALVRVNAGIYLLLPLGLIAFRFFEARLKTTPSTAPRNVGVTLQQMALVLGAFLIALAPFFFILKIVYGSYFDISASAKYLRQAGEDWLPFQTQTRAAVGAAPISFFDRVAIPKEFRYLHLLFSSYWGVIWTTPIVAFGLTGLGLFWKKDRIRVLFFALAIFPTWHWFQTWPGSAFGHRYMLPLFFFYGFGFAALIDAAAKKFGHKAFYGCVGLVGLLAFWNYAMLIQHEVAVAYNDPQFCLTAFKNFFSGEKSFPFFRTTSIFSLMFDLGRFRFGSALGFFMLILTPVFVLLVIGIALVLCDVLFSLEWNFSQKRRMAIAALAFFSILSLTLSFQNKPFSKEARLERFLRTGTELVRLWPAPSRHHLTGVLMGRYALELDPEDARARAFFKQANLFLAQQYADHGNFPQALTFFRRLAPYYVDPAEKQKYDEGLRHLEAKVQTLSSR